MELKTEALLLQELARGLVCQTAQGWLEFSLKEVIGGNCIFWSVIKITRFAWWEILSFQKDSPFSVPCSFLSYWIGCSHLPLLTASQLHVVEVPLGVDQ